METQTQLENPRPSAWERSTTRCFLGWLFSKRTLGRLAFGVAALATLVGLCYGVENWRGKRAWTQFKKQMEAQGERLDWAAFIPPAVPDEKNFAATPFLQLICIERHDSAKVAKVWPKDFNAASELLRTVRQTKKSASRPERKMIDLAAWEAAFVKAKTGRGEVLPEEINMDPAARAKAAAVVLESLKIYEPVLEELRQASTRPECRFGINYGDENPMMMLFSHLARLKGCCNLLQVRTGAELALGQAEQAAQDVRLMLRLAEALKNEPILISFLVEIAIFRITTDVIWQGLAQGQWTDAQVQDFQGRLQRFDFLAGLERSMRAERAMGIKAIEFLRKKPNRGRVFQEWGTVDDTGLENLTALERFFNIMPSGWLYWEQYNYARSFPMPDKTVQTRRVDPARCLEIEREMEEMFGGQSGLRRVWDHRILSAMLLPALTRAQMRAAEAQTVADQVTVACALERYRRTNGQLPEQLQALLPRFIEKLPSDVITGAPLIYRRTNDGQYVLYSVGWNEKDDGGLVSLKQTSTNAHDWVWRSQVAR